MVRKISPAQAIKNIGLPLVNAFRNDGFSAYIAGGVVRDYVLGGQFKDIDIFISSKFENEKSDDDFIKNIHHIIDVVGFKGMISKRELKLTKDNLLSKSNYIPLNPQNKGFRVYESTFFFKNEEIVVQFIFTNSNTETLVDFIGTFDLGINMVAIGQNNGIVKHPKFLEDVENNKITIYSNNQKTRSRAYGLQKKYKNFHTINDSFIPPPTPININVSLPF